jgi:RNA polymerase sigma-70 factor (ECF subfamily)
MAGDVEAAYEDGRARHPDLSLDLESFARYLDERLEGPPPRGEIAADLYLACACLTSEARAIDELEQRYLSLVPQFVASVVPPHETGEIQQRLRERLLVARDGVEPKLAEYRGRGRLASWLRVVALRVALNFLSERGGGREIPSDSDDLLASPDPELEYLRARYAPQFHQAFTQALAALEARDRTVLRLHLVDGLSIDRIGQLYEVHRATAARWLAQARDHLFDKTRARLHDELGLSATEFASIVKLVRSQLDVSICRILEESAEEAV